MDALNNKPVLSKSTKRNLRRKEQRCIKKARLGGSTIPDADDDQHTAPDSNTGQDNERPEIFYDPQKVSLKLLRLLGIFSGQSVEKIFLWFDIYEVEIRDSYRLSRQA